MSHHTSLSDRPLRLLGVFAHPDDEVFCAGGALAEWDTAGGETMVLSATRGEAGQIQDAHAATRQTLGQVRERELLVACARLGVGRVTCLDYSDGTLADVDADELAHAVADAIRDFRPDVVVTFGPDGGYGHPDHIAISVATTRACELIAREDGWAPQLYYSVFPRQHGSLCGSLARWLAGRGEFRGSAEYVRALTLLADEAVMLGHADDAVDVQWFPAGFAIVEQGERAGSLYLIISGCAEIVREDAAGQRSVLRTLEAGQFFGAEALAYHTAHAATVVARDTVTCLVLAQAAPTAFAGRGEGARLDGPATIASAADDGAQVLCLDVADSLDRKVAALAAHRSQFAIPPALPALAPVWRLLVREYFVVAPLAVPSDRVRAASIDATRWPGARALLAVPA
ncbi:MAG TPA: PIG-L family deacetylase [Ktedonobacterales bacterium]|nr:PIG-L family deacetylase [Ktedonobacterales bacterium]